MRRKILLVIFGVIISLFISELILHLSGHIYYLNWMRKEYNYIDRGEDGYVKSFLVKIFNKEKIKTEDKNLIKIICVGDSWTFGHGADPGYSYPAQLQRILNKENPKKYRVYNCGIPGCVSIRLLKHLPELMGKYSPDMVIVLIGMNDDIYPPQPSEFILLLSRPKKYYYYLKSIIIELRVYKVIRFGMEGLKRKIKVSEKHPPIIKRDINPESSEYSRIGSEFFKSGKFEMAKNYFEKAINIDANNEGAYVELGYLYLQLGKNEQSLLTCEKLLTLNPYTSYREDMYRLLFAMYQHSNFSKNRIKAIVKNMPSDERFQNPGMPFILKQERVKRNLERNLKQMITLIKSKKAIPVFQLYPRGSDTDIIPIAVSKKYNIPLVDHKTFIKLLDVGNYFGRSHPNGKGYCLMAENVYKAIKAIERNE